MPIRILPPILANQIAAGGGGGWPSWVVKGLTIDKIDIQE